MNETKEDIERRKRLHEWFKSDPAIWLDVADELNLSLHNEQNALKSRVSSNRDWSAGYVSSHEFILGLKDWIVRKWNPPTEIKAPKG